jgi:crotonobetainyl-CoA:carnitine CoA-transferase CaiB-like acyl-CoA transferase
MLADMGMEVIKIEAPGGEKLRGLPPLRDGVSSSYGYLNAGKKSIVLDLKSPAGADAFRHLVRDADIVVENYRPGVMQRLGLSYESLRELKPDLIYCAISGYGQSGPSALLPAYATVIHAASGYDMAHLSSQNGRTRPDICGVMIADYLSGTYAFGAIMTALAIRERSGVGQMVDVSMLESMLNLLMPEVLLSQFGGARVSPNGPLETSDGYFICSFAADREFNALAVAVGREEWRTDPRFSTALARRDNWSTFRSELETWTLARTAAECQAVLDAAGVPCAAYREVADVLKDPQLAHRRAISVVTDAAGSFQAMNPPFLLSEHQAAVGARVAAVGEHTEAVLKQSGLSEAELAAVVGGSAEASS